MKMMTASIRANRSTGAELVGEADCKKIVNMIFPPESVRDTDYSLRFITVPRHHGAVGARVTFGAVVW
jgi:hypothetical protein